MTMRDSTPLKEAGHILKLQQERERIKTELAQERYIGFTDYEVRLLLRLKEIDEQLTQLGV